MFDTKQLSDINDPYFLMKYYNTNNLKQICEHIHKITNHNCLNFIAYTWQKPMVILFNPMKLLKQNCIVNNVSRPRYICALVEQLNNYNQWPHLDILNELFNNKYYNMIKILLGNDAFYSIWITSFFVRYSDEKFDDAIKELNFIITSKSVYPLSVRNLISNFRIETCLRKTELVNHIDSTYINNDSIYL
jgi:hypothetical protein